MRNETGGLGSSGAPPRRRTAARAASAALPLRAARPRASRATVSAARREFRMTSALRAQTRSARASRLRPESAASATRRRGAGRAVDQRHGPRANPRRCAPTAPRRGARAEAPRRCRRLPWDGTVGRGPVVEHPGDLRGPASGAHARVALDHPGQGAPARWPRTTRSGSGSPNDAPERPSMRARFAPLIPRPAGSRRRRPAAGRDAVDERLGIALHEREERLARAARMRSAASSPMTIPAPSRATRR